jgi:ABC-type phosphate/phosphonate transport system permease subunit
MSTNNINQLFENQNNWDFEEPNYGHEKRFLVKLRKRQPKKKFNWISFSIAASLLLFFGLFYFTYTNPKTTEVVFSPQVQQTHDYFSSVINSELAVLKEKETPQSKVLINDAMSQMNSLEQDYDNLKLEIERNGENKQIIYAMITNMQTRISFIKSVLDQVENINKLKIETNEKQL